MRKGIATKIVIPLKLFKKRNCCKCGCKLKISKRTFDVYPGDEKFYGSVIGFDLKTVIEFYYECPECGEVYLVNEQEFISRVQKITGKKILTHKELGDYFKSPENLHFLRVKRKKRLILSILTFLLTMTFAFFSGYFYLTEYILKGFLFFCLTGFSILFTQNSISMTKKAKQLIDCITNPISKEEQKLKKLENAVKRHLIEIGVFILIIVGYVMYVFFLMKKLDNTSVIMFAIIGIVLLSIFVLRLINLSYKVSNLRDYKEYLKNRNE